MASTFSLLEDRLKAIQQADIERNAFITDLHNTLEELQKHNKQLQRDYKNEKSSRERYQDDLEAAEVSLTALRRDLDDSAYNLTLIDGDGAPFLDELYKKGAQGGPEAASLLASAIKSHLNELNPNEIGNRRSMVQIYINRAGLSRKLYACNIIETNQAFDEFIQYFNATYPLMNIIDVGEGKERADHSIKDNFTFHVRNVTCKHVIFGGCHDRGYLNMLRECQHDKDISKKISLLSTFTNVQDEPETTNYNHVRFDSVFRSTNLPSKPYNGHTATASNTTQPATATAVPRVPATPPPASQPESSTKPAPPSTPVANGSPWSAVTNTGTNGRTVIPSKNDARRYVIINREDERIDEPIKFDKTALHSVQQKSRNNGHNFCNSMVLKGGCPLGFKCNHNHDVKSLSAAERTAIRQFAKRISCNSGVDCRDPDCYYGHTCMSSYNNGYCDFGNQCHYSDTHSMDLKPYHKIFEDGTIKQM